MSQTTLHPRSSGVPALWEATLDVFEAGQQVILDRIELVRAEVSEDLARLALGLAFVLGAGVLALLGYVALLAAVVVLLAKVLSTEAALAIGGGAHLLVGLLLAAIGTSSLKRMRLATPREAVHHEEYSNA